MSEIDPAVNSAQPTTVGGDKPFPPQVGIEEPVGGEPAGPKSLNYWQIVWRQFRRNYLGLAGISLVVIFFLLAVLAPFICNKYPYFWYSDDEGLSFPLFRALTNEDLILLLALVMIAAVPLTKWLVDRLNLRAWQTRPLARALAFDFVNIATMLLLAPMTKFFLGAIGLDNRIQTALGATAIVLLLLAPLTVWLLKTVNWDFWSLHRLRRAMLVNLLVMLTISGWIMMKPQTYRITKMINGFAMERDYRIDLEQAEPGKVKTLFPPVRFSPTDIDEEAEPFSTPSVEHSLGTDKIGRSNIARVIYGTRVALFVGFISVGLSTIIGLLIGGISGYFSGWVDLVLQRLVEIWSAFPTLFLLLTIVALWGPRLWVIMVAIGLVSWTGTSRMIRANVLQVRTLDYITAARALGARTLPIIIKHALPNSIAPVLVSVSFGIAGAVFLETTLAFLGLSDPDRPSWGAMLNEARDVALEKPSLLIIPGVAIFLAVLAYNLMGEGLRDALDPRMKS